MPDTATLKQNHRKQLFARRKQLSIKQRQTYSTHIIQHLLNYLHQIPQNGTLQLLAYKALPFEVDTALLFEDKQFEIFVPRMLPDMGMEWIQVKQGTQWEKVAFGVLEPKQGEVWQASSKATVLVCPLLGFDDSGNRLGMGKGFFDRWLGQCQHTLVAQVGLAFSCQALPKVPTEPHDAPLSAIITESGVISCPSN